MGLSPKPDSLGLGWEAKAGKMPRSSHWEQEGTSAQPGSHCWAPALCMS